MDSQIVVSPSWSVVATCSEPMRLVSAFIAHHLSIGASQVFIFFDEPRDGLAHVFGNIPDVTAINCDTAYWDARRKKGGRPINHRKRQTTNAEYAARELCKTDWIAHIDIDELIFPRDAGSVSQLLAKAPANIDAVRVHPAERMFDGGYEPGRLVVGGPYKLKPPRRLPLGDLLYNEFGAIFPKGFQGHEQGKSFRRTAKKDIKFNIHFVRRGRETVEEYEVSTQDAVLLHHFPASFEDWCHKFERRIDDPDYFGALPENMKMRYGIYNLAREDEDPKAIEKLFQMLCVLPKDSTVRTQHPDLFIDPELDIDAKVAELVSPHLGKERFHHVSTPSLQPIPEHQRIFQIGMNRGGSKEICAMLGRSGMSYAHWDRGQLALNLKSSIETGSRPFADYDHYQVISDLSHGARHGDAYDGFYEIEFIHKHYPSSIYVLNYRPVDEWIFSRMRFRGGKLMREHMDLLGTSAEDDVIEHWARQWQSHVGRVRAMRDRGDLRLIEFSLNTEKPAVFLKKLEAMLDETREHHL